MIRLFVTKLSSALAIIALCVACSNPPPAPPPAPPPPPKVALPTPPDVTEGVDKIELLERLDPNEDPGLSPEALDPQESPKSDDHG